MIKCLVTFLSPGTFFSEQTTKEINDWCHIEAVRMAADIKERYGATPYGFYFTTRERGPEDFDSKEIERSGTFHLGGKLLSIEDIKNRNDPKDSILISNMECNDWSFVVENTNSWRSVHPLEEDDIFLTNIEASARK